MFAARLANLKHGQRPDREISLSVTVADAAERCGVDPTSVAQAKRLRREAAPEVVEAVERGHPTHHAAGQFAHLQDPASHHRGGRVASDGPRVGQGDSPAPWGAILAMRRSKSSSISAEKLATL